MVPAAIRWTWLWTAVIAVTLTLLAPRADATTLAGGTLPDGTFESGLDGFVAVGASRVSLSRDGAGRSGSRAMVVRTDVAGPVAARSTGRFVGSHRAGAGYFVRTWVKASVSRRVALRVREIAGGRVVQTRVARPLVSAGDWHRVRVRVETRREDSTLALAVRGHRFRTTDRLRVDDLRIAPVRCDRAAGCDDFTARGIPATGVLVGAAHGSNSDPADLERAIDGRLGVRRTYYTADGVASAVRTAREDLGKDRLPWLSFKLPYRWDDMAAGAGDRWARNLAARLAELDGPVWVAFHHEPEGDGDIQQWRKMQERLAPIVRSTAPNVAFTVIVTGWHQFYGDDDYALSEIWPRNTKVDVAGFDIYQQYGVVKDGRTTTSWTDFSAYFRQIADWAAATDVAWALGETGVTGAAAAARPAIIPDTVELMAEYGGIAYSYFDTTLNSIADWTLSTGPKRKGFEEALSGSPRLP